MRNYLILVCALFVLRGTGVYGQEPAAKPAEWQKSNAPQELVDLIDAKLKVEWDAIKNKDAKALGELLTDDYIAVEADREGERYKWKVLAELQNSAVTDYTLSFLKVTQLCPEAAFVRYEVFVRFPPKSTVHFEKIMVGEVWVKRDNLWKSMHYQETKVK
jgi:ketosteroid isomerase-like protein